MIQTLKKNIVLMISIVVLALAGSFVVAPMAGAADIQDSLCSGADNLTINTSSTCDEISGQDSEGLNNLITRIINIFSVVVGIVAVIMIIVGGFKYITSSGDSNNVTSAKNTIMYAIIGLIIVALAQVIVRFVLSSSTTIGG